MSASDRAGAGWTRREVIAACGALGAWSVSGAGPREGKGPVATTGAGKISGLHDGPVNVFKGVPYGASTAGANRFAPPQPVVPWSGIRRAVALGPRCPQVPTPPASLIEDASTVDATSLGEDCLCLNVWTAGVNDGRKRPVMVWLHGGGYVFGSGGSRLTDGARLAALHDVVVVTINHRLNVFGYLYLAELDGEAFRDSGCHGLLDIVQALQWVRDNITEFGGDPSRVTIFGESGGGNKVTTLMAAPAARGLFHRAIAESGLSFRQATPEDATRAARAVLDKLGIAANQTDKLRTVPAEQLLLAMQAAKVTPTPVVDGRTLPTHPFDPQAPKLSEDVPLIIGTNLTESTFMVDTPVAPIDAATLLQKVQANLGIDAAQAGDLIATYRRVQPDADNTFIYQLISTNSWLTQPTADLAARKAQLGGAPVYVYRFDKATPVQGNKLRTPHTVEVPYVFDNIALGKAFVGTGADKQALASWMSATWTAFAHTGIPAADKGLPQWTAYDPQRRAVMVINDSSRIVDDPGHDERLAIAAAKAQAARAKGA
jgi:para-nitrobenzyl esterase